MKFAYIRPTKLHPEAEQRIAILRGGVLDEWYVDEKPARGQPGWYWWDKLIRACRPGEADEIHVSDASVIADSEAFARNQAARRERAAKKMAEIERMWRDPTVSTGDALRAAGGLSRHALYKRFGPRGTPRFGRDA
jgi:hypothetical protein